MSTRFICVRPQRGGPRLYLNLAHVAMIEESEVTGHGKYGITPVTVATITTTVGAEGGPIQIQVQGMDALRLLSLAECLAHRKEAA